MSIELGTPTVTNLWIHWPPFVVSNASATSPEKLPKVYWACQVGMLEILQRIGTPSAELWSRVEQLRSTSPDLGGVGLRVQLEAFPAVQLMCR